MIMSSDFWIFFRIGTILGFNYKIVLYPIFLLVNWWDRRK